MILLSLFLNAGCFLRPFRQPLDAVVLERLPGLLLAVGIHLSEEHFLLHSVEAVLQRLLPAIRPVQVNLQQIADLPR